MATVPTAALASDSSEADARFAALTDRCHRLVRFLHELASTSAEPVTSVEDCPLVLWMDDLPTGLSLFDQARPGEVLLVAPIGAALPPPPEPPELLRGRILLPEPGVPPPDVLPLRASSGASAGDLEDGDDVDDVDDEDCAAAYREWLPTWQTWAARARAEAARRRVHNLLYDVSQRLSQQGDAFELVLATGLLSWQVDEPRPAGTDIDTGVGFGVYAGTGVDPTGRRLRRHLLTTRLAVDVDPTSSAIRLRLPTDAVTRLEDGVLLDGVPAFRPERTNALHERLRGRDAAPLGGDDERLLRDWLAVALDTPTEAYSPSWRPEQEVGSRPHLARAPALVLRHRGRAALLNYYEQMLDALRGDGRPPLGLAQLVETIEAPERLAWLSAEGAASGLALGADPLFPLPTNPEQARVMKRLRHDSGVVVEGPPGTGKTHTIANLVAALLAQGQRVLVTSQKAQALRVLRDKLPPELRRLCVSMTDSSDTASTELAASVNALAAEKAAYDPASQERRVASARTRRDAARQRKDRLTGAVRTARSAERMVHREGIAAPGWGGSRAGIAARLHSEQDQHGWIPLPVPPTPPAAEASPVPPASQTSQAPQAPQAPQTSRISDAFPSFAGKGGTRAAGTGVPGRREGAGSSAGARTTAWPPPAPLSSTEAGELLRLLRTRTATRRHRLETTVVAPGAVVPASTVRALLDRERSVTENARSALAGLGAGADRLVEVLAAYDATHLETLHDIAADLVRALGQVARHTVRHSWVRQALDDVLAGRDAVLWTKATTAGPVVAEAATALAEVGLRSVVLPAPSEREAAEPAALLAITRALREHLAAGRKLRRVFKPRVQKDAAGLLATGRVDGVPPRTAETLTVVEAHLRAQAGLATVARVWAMVGVDVDGALPAEVRLARFGEAQEALDAIVAVSRVRDRAHAVLRAEDTPDERADEGAGVPIGLDSTQDCRDLAAAVDAARAKLDAAEATQALRQIHDGYLSAASDPDAPPELTDLAAALADRDVGAYASAVASLAGIAAERADEQRCVDLLGRLERACPRLAAMLAAKAADEAWDARLAEFEAAWAWGCAASWLAGAPGTTVGAGAAGDAGATDTSGTANTSGTTAGTGGGFGAGAAGGDTGGGFGTGEVDANLDAELDAAEDAFAAATADLASALAWGHCLERMGTEQSAALRAYADAVAAGGNFTGRYADRYRQAARDAMRIAQTAVPAWVMPIGEVLSTIPAVRDCFDVVIVDEGSQAGLDSLFLLWLAPRVIVVGDDRQCTPTEATFNELAPVFHRLDTLLPDVPSWLRVAFTPRSSLFTLLRTRFGEVVRLREHFRCMPEIIEWSSAMFYRDAPLVPLRQFGADRLPPLRSRFVPHGYTTGGTGGLRNPAEAEALVAQVLSCAEDPHYDGLSFGVVVLQGSAQADLIRNLLNARMSVTEQQRRRLRVGTPPDFQGDERDVVFLSLVVAAESSTTSLTRLEYQRRFNVAASRARDQVWVFHSVSLEDLEPADLRHSYLGYVLARSHTPASGLGWPARPAPRPREVSHDVLHPSFDTLFEQRVYRVLAERGYQVAPQAEVNGWRVDLVVSGGQARIAVECDGDNPVPEEQAAFEFARERELRRAGWRFVRIRQSRFELDPEAALAPLWETLAEAGIDPAATAATAQAGGDGQTSMNELAGNAAARTGADGPDISWSPIVLNDMEGLDDAPEPSLVAPAAIP
jgi:very-short-patch-repair endonuclease